MENSAKDNLFSEKLKGKKIPILTLDKKWHQIFVRAEKTPEIKELETKLNDLLKRQGKVNTETKQINGLKKKLMSEIIDLSARLDEDPDSKELNKEMETHTRLVNECKEKLDAYQDEILDLPRLIDEANTELMHETMRVCYEWLQDNFDDIEVINNWIKDIRMELKTNMIRKQEMEMKNQIMYSYMHDIFGPEVMDIFDIRYDLSDNLLKTTPQGGSEDSEKNK